MATGAAALLVVACGGTSANHGVAAAHATNSTRPATPTPSTATTSSSTIGQPKAGAARGHRPEAAAKPRPLLPVKHSGAHPGAAALVGDIKHLAKASFIPTIKQAPQDGPGSGCQIGQVDTTPKYCAFGDKTAPKLTIALVGDSVAGEWLRGLAKVAVAHHWRIVTALHSRCPWTSTMTVNTGHSEPYTSCHTWGASVLHHLLTKLHPQVVITTDRPVLGTTNYAPGPTASTAIGRGMATYWKQLIAHHIAVVGFRESPEMGFDVPDCVAAKGHCSASRSQAVAATTPVVVADRLVQHGERMLDLTGLICAKTTCHPVVGNVLVYQDRHHLTNTYVLTMAPYLERKLLTVPRLAAAA